MRYLRTNTACRVTVGPFFDKTDGITPETALTVTNEKLTFMVDTANVPTLILDTAPTASGGANDMVHVTGDDAGFYDLELAAADVNYLGRAMLALTDAANHCPVFHEFMILPAVIYDSMVLGTDLFDVSATQILGTAISTPATAGILDVNLKNIANAAVSTSTAQLGVNAVQIGAAVPGSATIGTVTAVTNAVAITANQAVNVAQWGGSNIATPAVTGEPVVTLNATQAAYTPAKAGDAMLVTAGTGAGQLDFTSGVIKANLVQILAATITGTAANLVAAFTKWFNVTSPTGTVNSIPDAVAGANGGLPTTNGTKVSQTVDLTSGQSIACSDKTGFSLAATGLDLVTAASTFGVAMIAGIWAAATSAMTTVGSIGKKLADWVVGTITANQAVNVAQWGGSNIATPAVTGEPVVTLNATQAAYTPAKAGDAMLVTAGTGAGQLDFTSGVIKANLVQILAATITGTAANLVAAFTKWFNVTSPTGTVNSIPDAVAGASGGLPTTNGTKLSQTADLTSGQSIACSDKTGFSLAATGLDLVTAASTFGAAMIAGIWAAATSAMTTVGSIGKKLADWVVGTIDTYTGNTKQTGDAYATLTAMKGTDNKILVSTDAQDLSGTLSVNAKKLNGQAPPLGSDNKMQITTDAMTEAYAADGAAPSIQQALFAIQQFLQESSVLSTTLTVKKLNGSTVAMTFSLDSATTPTSITRAS
jgi:hypothetical protein